GGSFKRDGRKSFGGLLPQFLQRVIAHTLTDAQQSPPDFFTVVHQFGTRWVSC
ncbi:MAG: hypothetical protein JNJ50_31165, partial [Acidobacteria bacterium]|nr:hypothetical protein [Acidobacteriota bacterium]